MYTFIDLLKKIRNEGNHTQEDFANLLDVSTVLIAMIETGQKKPSRAFIEKLASKLEVHPTSIMPFAFMDKDVDTRKFSKVERALVAVGEDLQDYLVNTKARKLRK